MEERLFRKQQVVSSNLTVASTAARVPGIGLLNRTFESWADRHEVQLLRGLPKYRRLCSSTGKSKRLISARLVVQLHPQPPNFGLVM